MPRGFPSDPRRSHQRTALAPPHRRPRCPWGFNLLAKSSRRTVENAPLTHFAARDGPKLLWGFRGAKTRHRLKSICLTTPSGPGSCLQICAGSKRDTKALAEQRFFCGTVSQGIETRRQSWSRPFHSAPLHSMCGGGPAVGGVLPTPTASPCILGCGPLPDTLPRRWEGSGAAAFQAAPIEWRPRIDSKLEPRVREFCALISGLTGRSLVCCGARGTGLRCAMPVLLLACAVGNRTARLLCSHWRGDCRGAAQSF